VETYGEDFGQTSWVTNEESEEIPRLLDLNGDSYALEIGCGSGGYALHLAEETNCRLVGVDVNTPGIRNGNELAEKKGLSSRVQFEERDVSKGLQFDANTFDAVFANDVLCHLPRRPEVLGEVFRVLKPGGRMLFSDALVIGGMISHEEIANRSSIGFYVYSPPGENERLLGRAGFGELRVTDTTENAADISKRWHDARQQREKQLVEVEGETNFHGLQRFLAGVQSLTSERRLLRYLYWARKAS
jgi:SAM-dependent methyltransferase